MEEKEEEEGKEEEEKEEEEDEGEEGEEKEAEEKGDKKERKEKDAIFKTVQKNLFRWKDSQKLDEAGSLLNLPIWFNEV
jgi:hypothetical protein